MALKTGSFRARHPACFAGEPFPAECRCRGRKVTVLMHQTIIFERMGSIGHPKSTFVNHENGDSLDNWRRKDVPWVYLRVVADAERKRSEPARYSPSMPVSRFWTRQIQQRILLANRQSQQKDKLPPGRWTIALRSETLIARALPA
jgi:hypothetical protein